MAVQAIDAPQARERARADLFKDMFAGTSRSTRRAHVATLRRLARAARIPLVPITPDGLFTLAAALKAGRYRAAAGMLGTLRRLHLEAGHVWGPELGIARTDAVRSAQRGQGPPRRARTVRLEEIFHASTRLEPLVEG